MTTPAPTGPVATWDDDALEALCCAGIPGYDPWRDAGSRYHFDVGCHL